MGALLKWLLVILAIIWLVNSPALRSLTARKPPSKTPRGPGSRGKGEEQAATQPIVACAHCELHLPVGDAVHDSLGRPYCCNAHRTQGPSTP